MEASSIVAYTGGKIIQRDSANQIQPPVFKRAVDLNRPQRGGHALPSLTADVFKGDFDVALVFQKHGQHYDSTMCCITAWALINSLP